MGMRSAMRLAVVCALLILPGASIAGGRYDGDWVTHLACEAHGETPAYKFMFPSTIKDGNFHGQHGEEGGPGYLVIDGKIADDLHVLGGETQACEFGGILRIDRIDAIEALHKPFARKFIRARPAAQASVNARGVHQVAAEIEDEIGAIGHPGNACAERVAHVILWRNDVRLRKQAARELRFAPGRVVVGNEEQRNVGLRCEPQQRADERPHPAGELPRSVARDRDAHGPLSAVAVANLRNDVGRALPRKMRREPNLAAVLHDDDSLGQIFDAILRALDVHVRPDALE